MRRLVVVLPILLAACASPPPSPEPPVSEWSLSFHDGSNNGTTVEVDGQGARFAYDPVTPAMSSSGSYSGGEPASGPIAADAAAAIRLEAERLLADEGLHVQGRAMGTARLALTTDGGEQRCVLRMGSYGQLSEQLEGLRK